MINKEESRTRGELGYWLDNCGDGEWYCEHCLQPECGKRMYPRKQTKEWVELKQKEGESE